MQIEWFRHNLYYPDVTTWEPYIDKFFMNAWLDIKQITRQTNFVYVFIKF